MSAHSAYSPSRPRLSRTTTLQSTYSRPPTPPSEPEELAVSPQSPPPHPITPDALPPAYGEPSSSRRRRPNPQNSTSSRRPIGSDEIRDDGDDDPDDPSGDLASTAEGHVAIDDKAVLAMLTRTRSEPGSSSSRGGAITGDHPDNAGFDLGDVAVPDEETLAAHEHEVLFSDSATLPMPDASPVNDPASYAGGRVARSATSIPLSGAAVGVSSSLLPSFPPGADELSHAGSSSSHPAMRNPGESSNPKSTSDPLPAQFQRRGTVRRLSASSTRSDASSFLLRDGAVPAYDDTRGDGGDSAVRGDESGVALPDIQVPRNVVREYERLARGDMTSGSGARLEDILGAPFAGVPLPAAYLPDEDLAETPSAPPLEDFENAPSAPPLDDLEDGDVHTVAEETEDEASVDRRPAGE